jgi:phosphatidate cytidylyltransferase
LKDLIQRTVSGIVYVLFMLTGVAIHPVVFLVVFGAFLFLTQLEFYKLVETAGTKPRTTIGVSMGILCFVVCFGAVNSILPAKSYLIFIPALTFIFLVEAFSPRSGILHNSALTLTGFVYVAIPFSLLNFIIHPGYPVDPAYEWKTIMGVFFIVWGFDSMAYLVGSKFGKHKIHPKISPNKSWEGFIAGTLFSLATGFIYSIIFKTHNLFNWLVIALLASVFGTLGDLFESIIKRRLKVKDSGNFMPGHGGLLDRFDSLLFVIPVVYVWLSLSGNL